MPMSRLVRSWPRWPLLMGTLWAAWGLRLFRLDVQDIWWDEARNIDVATRAWSQIANAPELDIHPPLYFYTLHAWTRVAGASSFATRFLSVWFGVLTVVLVYRLARHLVRDGRVDVGLLALVLAAFAPYALAEAQETRMYTMSWALLAGGMLALLWAWQRPASWWRWAGFGFMAGLALVTHYSTVFILGAWGLGLLVWAFWPCGSEATCLGRGQRLLRLILAAGVGVVIFLPVVPIAWRQIPGYDNPNLTLLTLHDYLAQLYQAFTLGEFIPPTVWAWGKWIWGGVMLVGVGGWLILEKQREARTQWRTWALLAWWLAGGLLLFYLILIARSAFNPRYISFVLPALWALAGWALGGLRGLARPLPWVTLAILLGLALPSLYADLFDPAHFREDMSGVVAYLHAQATPNDIILVDQRYPFGFYWERWNNDFYGVPPSQPADEAPAQYLFVDIDGIDQRLIDLAGQAQRVFWVTWFESDMDPRGAVTALLDAYGQRVDEKAFRGYTVRVWQMHPPTHFQLPRDFVPLNIPFEPGMMLVEGDWGGRTQPVAPGQPILVTLRWRAQGPTQQALKASLRLKDASGATVAQDDRLILSNRHLRTTAWGPGEEALNVYLLHAPEAPGIYDLAVVVYDEDTLAAVGTADGRGVEPVFGQVQVRP